MVVTVEFSSIDPKIADGILLSHLTDPETDLATKSQTTVFRGKFECPGCSYRAVFSSVSAVTDKHYPLSAKHKARLGALEKANRLAKELKTHGIVAVIR